MRKCLLCVRISGNLHSLIMREYSLQKVIRTIDMNVSYGSVRATKGKYVRAEPISALYEQQKVFHTNIFPQLEDQMCSYTGDNKKSPDRLDALVWALTELSASSRKPLWRIS